MSLIKMNDSVEQQLSVAYKYNQIQI